jgi:starch synthase
MRYGTVPVVRETGGLKDSVGNYDPVSNPDGRGFTFSDIVGENLLNAVGRAVDAYHDRDLWTGLMKKDMMADFSWNKSAKDYESIYRLLLLQH